VESVFHATVIHNHRIISIASIRAGEAPIVVVIVIVVFGGLSSQLHLTFL